jgi:nucleoside-diphosphate-sugar epimerase
MKLTVVGATGGVGRSVVSQALDADEDVAGDVRNAAKLQVTHPRLSVIAGERAKWRPSSRPDWLTSWRRICPRLEAHSKPRFATSRAPSLGASPCGA